MDLRESEKIEGVRERKRKKERQKEKKKSHQKLNIDKIELKKINIDF